jgi:hypothetical protein
MPQRVSVVRVSLGEGVGYVLDLTAEVLALFDKEGERKTYLILQEILTDMRLIERASMADSFITQCRPLCTQLQSQAGIS